MASPQILYTELRDGMFTMSSSGGWSTTTGHPITNLSSYEKSDYVEFVVDTLNPLYINMNMNTNYSASQVIVDIKEETHFAEFSITLQAADNATFTSNFVDFGILSSNPGISSVSAMLDFTKTGRQYWRLVINEDLGPLSISKIFLGVPLQFPNTYDYNFNYDAIESVTEEKVSLDGTRRFCQTHDARGIHELNFSYQSGSAFDTDWRNFITNNKGKLRPFYFNNKDNTTRYVHIDNDYQPIIQQRYGLYSIEGLKLTEHEAER